MNRPRPLTMPDPPEGGTITSIVYQKKDSGRCSIYLDGAFAFGVHVEVAAEAGLRKNMTLTEAACRDLLEKDRFFRVMKRALDLLAYRPRSRAELRRRMVLLGASPDIMERIETRLDTLGLLDDEAFARQFASSRLASGRYGPARIRRDLHVRGVPTATVERVLQDLVQPEKVEDLLRALMQKAMRRYPDTEPVAARRRRITGWLRRRGFGPEEIRNALDTFVPGD